MWWGGGGGGVEGCGGGSWKREQGKAMEKEDREKQWGRKRIGKSNGEERG